MATERAVFPNYPLCAHKLQITLDFLGLAKQHFTYELKHVGCCVIYN